MKHKLIFLLLQSFFLISFLFFAKPIQAQHTPTPAPPRGAQDPANCTSAFGWACDPDNYAQALNVHFYVDGPAGGGGTFVGAAVANQPSADVNAICGNTPNHRFIWPIPANIKTGTNRTIYAHALSVGGGNNTLLPGSPRTINCSNPLPPPPNQSYTCNNNGTITFRWGAVAGASNYGVRLNRITGGDWWFDSANDSYSTSSGTNATVAMRYGVNYNWAVSANRPDGTIGTWNWSAAFNCPALTPTPFVQIRTRTPGGAAAPVRGMSFSYNCGGGWALCFSTFAENTSSANIYGYGNVQGGAGIALNANQVLLGVSPVPAGGSSQIRNNNNNNIWWNYTPWRTYWWPSYPATGSRTVNYVVATMTPTPTPYCSDPDGGNIPNTFGTTRAWFTNGTSNTATDTCTGTFVAGSTTHRRTITEYSCQPPATGGNTTGTTRTSTTITCSTGQGCLGGACVCVPLNAPINVRPNGTIAPGTQNIQWNAVAGATSYAVRVDDLGNGTDANPCTSGKVNDRCANVTGTSYSYNFQASRSYRIWVHAVSSCYTSAGSTLVTATVPPPTPTPTPTPFCSDSDGGNNLGTRGTTTAWLTNGTNNSVQDTCGATALPGSTLLRTAVTEYSCQPPPGGGSGSGITRLNNPPPSTCPAGQGCYNGACQTAPDLVITSITRSCPNISITYRNSGSGTSATAYRIRFRRTVPGPNTDQFVAGTINLAPNATRTVSVTTASLGIVCDESMTITGTVDVDNSVIELNDANNSATLNAPPIAGEVFYKLRNASLHRLRTIDVQIPATMTQFDGDDTAQQLFVIGSAGVVTSNQNRTRVISASGLVSTNNWRKDNNDNYDESTGGYLQNIGRYSEYSRAQKDHQVITSMAGIGSTTINIFNGPLLTINASPAQSNFVLLVNGNVNITAAAGPVFNAPGNSMAIISTGTITINPAITTVNAILIANNIQLGASTTNRLKIKGNLISNTLIDMSTTAAPRNIVGTNSPNLFVVVDPKMYIDLLPHLSEITLNGRQVQ